MYEDVIGNNDVFQIYFLLTKKVCQQIKGS